MKRKALIIPLVLALTLALIPLSSGENTDQETFQSQVVAEHVLIGKVKNMESRWNDDRTSIYSYVTISVENWLTKSRGDEEITIKYVGGEVGDIGCWVSDQPHFSIDERVKVFLKLEETGEFTVAGGGQGKISLSISASSPSPGYSYSGYHWHSNSLPVKYYINELGTPDTTDEFTAVQQSFQTWEDDIGSYMDHTYMGTTNKSYNPYDGYNIVSWGNIDGVGKILARTTIRYYVSSKEIVECDIVFDEAETWSTTGEPNKFDVQNSGTHEAGHTLSLNDLYDPADSEETMYGYGSPGETKRRDLYYGDIAGIRYIYPGSMVTYTIATDPLGLQVKVDGNLYTAPKSFSWYPQATHTIDAYSPQSGGAGVRYVYTSWSDGGTQSHTITVGASDITITATYKIQYYLTVSSPYGTTSGDGWYDSGSTAYARLNTGIVSGAVGTRYMFTGWSGDASGTNYTKSNPIIINAPKTAVANWKTQYQLTISSLYGTTVGADWYDSGSTAYAGLKAGIVSGPVGTRYVFTGWSGDASGTDYARSNSITMSGPKIAVANWKTQYQVSLKLMTTSPKEIYPAQIKILGAPPNNTLIILTSYSNVWLDNVEWTAKQILWMGNNVVPDPNPKYSPTALGTWTIPCRVYAIDFTNAFKDSRGAALKEPSPPSFKLLCPNGTTTSALSVGSYYLQNGTYQWKSIVWRGIDVIPSPAPTFDPTGGSPTVKCRVYPLTVYVKDYLTLAVSGADVGIYLPDGTLLTSGRSGGGGEITFSQLPISDYKVEVTFLGLKTIAALSLTSDKTMEIIIFLSIPMLVIIWMVAGASIGGIVLASQKKRK